MFKILIIALDELKQRLRTEWAKLDHVVRNVVKKASNQKMLYFSTSPN